MPLAPKQRSFLRSLAHPLRPTVRVGKAKVTPRVIAEANRTLDAHELIKVKLDLEEGAERHSLAATLAERTRSELVTVVGKIAVLFRQSADEPRIKLP
jgi:RNA-binding protein